MERRELLDKLYSLNSLISEKNSLDSKIRSTNLDDGCVWNCISDDLKVVSEPEEPQKPLRYFYKEKYFEANVMGNKLTITPQADYVSKVLFETHYVPSIFLRVGGLVIISGVGAFFAGAGYLGTRNKIFLYVAIACIAIIVVSYALYFVVKNICKNAAISKIKKEYDKKAETCEKEYKEWQDSMAEYEICAEGYKMQYEEYIGWKSDLINEQRGAVIASIEKSNKECRQRISQINAEIDAISGLEYPEKYYSIIDNVIELIEDYRADSIKEAINLNESIERDRELQRIENEKLEEQRDYNERMEMEARRANDAMLRETKAANDRAAREAADARRAANAAEDERLKNLKRQCIGCKKGLKIVGCPFNHKPVSAPCPAFEDSYKNVSL